MNKPANRCGGRVIAPASLPRYPPLLSEFITFTLTPLKAMQGIVRYDPLWDQGRAAFAVEGNG